MAFGVNSQPVWKNRLRHEPAANQRCVAGFRCCVDLAVVGCQTSGRRTSANASELVRMSADDRRRF